MRKHKISASFYLFEAIKVELPNKGADSSVSEKVGKDLFLEFLSISDDYFSSGLVQPDDSLEISVLY